MLFHSSAGDCGRDAAFTLRPATVMLVAESKQNR